jgi:hypothetical protein
MRMGDMDIAREEGEDDEKIYTNLIVYNLSSHSVNHLRVVEIG